ncbi:putative LuxR family transcriptional regulator [Actinacidiphila reveromycinica]|uniref:Putative LuxR family transcriptional regulator n=1 Tax=Actinacidiphila reveromycinica TaxID=659352 RepID=A0A7U3UYB5_9ACTN|nr:helix-turn-helix domain-containing protein [Streptomyces sp. SN-593]BBB00882.1 putative LuxR family transcriptional regulator [Streptomyces sp. SN-593]
MLGAIGLDEAQESAYRALVALGAAELGELADRLAVTEEDAARLLRRLEGHGLVAQSSARPGRWVVAPPAVALSALLTSRRHALEQAELAAAVLAAEFRSEAAEPAVHDLVEVVTGAGAVAQRFLQLQFGAESEVCALVTGQPVAVSGADNDAEADAARRGVVYRVVLERDAVTGQSGLTELAAALDRDEQVRVVPRVPTKLVVADRTLAMVPLGRRAEPAALVVHASGLLEALMELFEGVWRQAMPLRLEPGGILAEDRDGQPDGTDLRILSLLLAGLTDTSTAKQLDLGLRTVQRRVKRLMEIAGVSTRLQLGWHAYERGWIARDGARAAPGGPSGPGPAGRPRTDTS